MWPRAEPLQSGKGCREEQPHCSQPRSLGNGAWQPVSLNQRPVCPPSSCKLMSSLVYTKPAFQDAPVTSSEMVTVQSRPQTRNRVQDQIKAHCPLNTEVEGDMCGARCEPGCGRVWSEPGGRWPGLHTGWSWRPSALQGHLTDKRLKRLLWGSNLWIREEGVQFTSEVLTGRPQVRERVTNTHSSFSDSDCYLPHIFNVRREGCWLCGPCPMRSENLTPGCTFSFSVTTGLVHLPVIPAL